jgi:hypothetical protein
VEQRPLNFSHLDRETLIQVERLHYVWDGMDQDSNARRLPEEPTVMVKTIFETM